MRTLSRSSTYSITGLASWSLNLATRMLACLLNMPEPLVHNTGIFVFVHVQAVETSVGRTLCLNRLWRHCQNWRRRSAR